MSLQDEIIAYQQQLEADRAFRFAERPFSASEDAHLDHEERELSEDVAKAEAAVFSAWMERA